MWELDCEESWAPKNWCFWTVVLEKTLESPLDCKEIQQVLLFSTQLCESLCVPYCGEHLGNWLLAGSVSLLLIPPFYPPGHLCLLPPSSLLCITLWTSLVGPDCGAHIRKWLLASLLSPLLIHIISFGPPLSPSSLFSSPCHSVNISGCPSLWRNFSSLT